MIEVKKDFVLRKGNIFYEEKKENRYTSSFKNN